ncbi:MAG: hypothetical protein JM58_14055 [Peptococcaceae bacterium BICA1-8]|nr:MAG: hypothetical protein JM58_14055 [Peptococcaceae bacterium BICA1-8]
MRIFLRNIEFHEIKYLSSLPIHGLVFSITQANTEKIRDIVEQVPIYLPIIGDLKVSARYEIEELIFFCKLKCIIIPEINEQHEYSCPWILRSDNTPYNVLINKEGKLATGNILLENIDTAKNIDGLILDVNELLFLWPKLLNIWTNIKVV